MAQAIVTHRWPDGCEIRVELYAESSYPDAIREVRAQTLGLYRDALAATVEVLTPDESDGK